jgi:hypothetical protein
MDLIDRYLIAVRRQLPRHLEDDIMTELMDSLRSEAEEHERATGRPMTPDEQAALLKKRGHPFVMASRYLPQQHLIGPALFPYYRQALKFVVFWVVVPIVLFGGALNAVYSDSPAIWARAIGAAWSGAIYAVGIVTIAFAILDHERVRFNVFDNWNPAKLPEPKEGRVVPRSETVFGLVFALTYLVWWTDLVPLPESIVVDGDRVRFMASPIWAELYFPILLSLVASVGVHLVDLIRPWRTFAVSAVDLAVNVVNVLIVTRILRADRYLEISGPPEHADQLALLDYWSNQIVEWVFLGIGAVVIFELCYEVWRMLRARRQFRTTISSTAP